MPKVSVIISSYNHEKYIADSIQSVLDQTFSDWEIIIRDDCSADGTLEIIKGFKDKRIKIIKSDKNIGQFASTNIGIKEAKGEYLCFLNSDDRFEKEKLKKQVGFLEKNKNIAAVFTRPKLIDDDGNLFINKSHIFYELFYLPHLDRDKLLHFFFFNGNYLCHPSVMIRYKVQNEIGFYNDFFAQISDIDYWVRLCFKYEIAMIEEQLTDFRIRKGEENMSGDKPSSRMRSFVEWKFILEYFLQIKDLDEFVSIFPEIKKKYQNLDKKLIPFYLAVISLDSPFEVHHDFALEVLYKIILQNSELRKLLEKKHNFTNLSFIKLSGGIDLYGYSEKKKVQNDIDLKRLDKILNSIPYKVWLGYKKIIKLIDHYVL